VHSELKPLQEVGTRMFFARTKLSGTIIAPPREQSASLVGAPPPGFAPPGFMPPPPFGVPPGIGPPPGFAPPGSAVLPPMGPPPDRQNSSTSNAAEASADIVTIEVTGIPSGKFARLSDLVHDLNQFRSHRSTSSGGQAIFQLAGIDDFEALPSKITFGNVVEVDKESRRIKVEFDPQKLP
jgi:hypothetical protein